jgi:ribose/xylose/arabinose/galactoside ABC-type transport system permease subunit
MTTKTAPAAEQGSLVDRFHISSSVVLVGIIILEIIFFTAVQPEFLTVTNVFNAARASSVMGIVAVGVTFGLISGAVDLSVASVLALGGVVAHTLLTNGVPGPIAVAGALVTGALFGLFNGIVTVRFRVNSLITTLGTLTIARGLAFGIAIDAAPISHDAFFNLFQTRLLGVPLAVLTCGLCFLVGWYVLYYTPFGRYAYAVGGNSPASWEAGLKVDRLRIGYLVISGFLAGLAGWVLASMAGAANKGAATGTELIVITAVLLGGVGFAGGSGSMGGTLIAVVLMGILVNGMSLMGLISTYQIIVIGLLLLVAMAAQTRRTGGWR